MAVNRLCGLAFGAGNAIYLVVGVINERVSRSEIDRCFLGSCLDCLNK